jgi:hypothetical protein
MQMKHVTLTWSRVDWSMLCGAQDGHARRIGRSRQASSVCDRQSFSFTLHY